MSSLLVVDAKRAILNNSNIVVIAATDNGTSHAPA